MAKTAKSDAAAMRYLLGDLPEGEASALEEDFFADDEKFRALELAEDELIDAYVRDGLSPEQQAQFKARVIQSPRLKERVNFARALFEKVRSAQVEAPTGSVVHPEEKRGSPWWKTLFAQQPAWRTAMAAGAILVMIAAALLISGWLRSRDQSDRLARERALQQQQELDQKTREQHARDEQQRADAQKEIERQTQEQKRIEDLKRVQNPDAPPQPSFLGSVVSLTLRPGSLRGGTGRNELILGLSDSTAQLELSLEGDDYPTYVTSIENVDGKVVYHRPHKAQNRGSGPVLVIRVPARSLPPNDYVINLSGVTPTKGTEPAGSYSFRVLTRK